MRMDKNMKKIRIACGAGCSFDRIEPSIELIKYGNIDYLIFECLAERTMSDNMLQKLNNPSLGYTPMLEERMDKLLKLAVDNNVKIITNMGASNIEAAIDIIRKVAREKGIKNFKIGVLQGDDITSKIEKYSKLNLIERKEQVENIENDIISANAYLGHDGIKNLLSLDVDMVITGRVADISLFTGPILYEFNWDKNDLDKLGQSILLGHLLECGGQITGGYFADPGYKDVKDLHKLGMPIGEISEDGEFIISKVDGTGGEISERVCKEQLLYEIKSPFSYITPDGTVDFSNVEFTELEKDKVKVTGCKVVDFSKDYKVNIGYKNGYMGIGEISFGGSNALEKAKLCEDIVRGRLKITMPKIDDMRFDYIGYSSLYDESISELNNEFVPMETRLRMTVRGKDKTEVDRAVREIDFMYTNGPSGSSGIDVRTKIQIGIDNILIPRDSIDIKTKVVEI